MRVKNVSEKRLYLIAVAIISTVFMSILIAKTANAQMGSVNTPENNSIYTLGSPVDIDIQPTGSVSLGGISIFGSLTIQSGGVIKFSKTVSASGSPAHIRETYTPDQAGTYTMTVNLTYTLSGMSVDSSSYTVTFQVQKGGTSANAVGSIRYDGLYSNIQDDTNSVFRFYEDGTSIQASIGQTDKDKVSFPRPNWFHKDHFSFNYSPNTYTINGNNINIKSTSESGTVEYNGTIGENKIKLSWHSYINGNNGGPEVFEFYPFSKLEAWQEEARKYTTDDVKNDSKVTPTADDTSKSNSTTSSETKTTVTKKANPMAVAVKKVTVSFKTLKKKNVSFAAKKAFTIKKAKGKVTYKKTAGSKKIIVSKAGKITVKKGLKKGKYPIKVKVTAAGNKTYKAKSKTVKLTITVK